MPKIARYFRAFVPAEKFSLSPRSLINFLIDFGFKGSLIFINLVLFLILTVLCIKAFPILLKKPIGSILFSSIWLPSKGEFGAFPFIISSIEVSLLAMVIAVPVCVLSAIYLSEYAGKKLRTFSHFTIDVLAGIPSVIFGLCGVIVLVPLVKDVGHLFGIKTTGYSLLAGGIILAVMIIPIIISILMEVFRAIPMEARETAFALGATKWEVISNVILRSAPHGLVAAIILGFARAFGETLAVLMVVGNIPVVPHSLFDPAYPLPALIANNYGEMMTIPLYDSSLMLSAVILMIVVGAFSFLGHVFLIRIERWGKK